MLAFTVFALLKAGSACAEPALPDGCIWHAASSPKFIPNHYLTCPAQKGGIEVEREPQGIVGTDQDFNQKIFAAADLGDGKSMRVVGDFLLEYWKTRNQPKVAMEWYRRAAGLGDGVAMIALSRASSTGHGADRDPAEAVRWFKSAEDAAIAANDPEAMVAIGFTLNGQFSVPRDNAEAMRWFKMAADTGSALGKFEMGSVYEWGFLGQRDGALARKWYEAAAAAGDPLFETMIGSLYRRGIFPMTKDGEQAERLYRLAADKNDTTAMLFLARMYEQGDGVAKNETEAVDWYRMAAELGDVDAMEGLGAMYRDGRGVKADSRAWARWFAGAVARRAELPPPQMVMVPLKGKVITTIRRP